MSKFSIRPSCTQPKVDLLEHNKMCSQSKKIMLIINCTFLCQFGKPLMIYFLVSKESFEIVVKFSQHGNTNDEQLRNKGTSLISTRPDYRGQVMLNTHTTFIQVSYEVTFLRITMQALHFHSAHHSSMGSIFMLVSNNDHTLNQKK